MITLHAVGDVWIKDGIRRPEPPGFREVIQAFGDADVRFANVEAPISRRGFPSDKYACLRSDPSVVKGLTAMGLDVVSLANNHTMDYGSEALLDTLDVLDESGIKHVGAGRNLDEALKCALFELKGRTLAFLAFSSVLPSGGAGQDRPGLAPVRVYTSHVIEPTSLIQEEPGRPPQVTTFAVQRDLERLQSVIGEARQLADWVMVSLHWGIGGEQRMLDYQLQLGHAAAAAGADVIIGHHPHTLQGIEIYKGSLICYSLGNFVFEDIPPQDNSDLPVLGGIKIEMGRDTAILRFVMEDEHEWQARILPLTLDERGYPQPGEAAEQRGFVDNLSTLCEPFGTRVVPEKRWVAITGG